MFCYKKGWCEVQLHEMQGELYLLRNPVKKYLGSNTDKWSQG